MTKILAFVIIAMMVIQIIKPLGLPGLRQRRDFWKLAVLAMAAISLAAVIGVPHESHGEEIKAFVILKPGASATADEIVAWGKEQMAAYKYPRVVEIVESLPMTATGKILKRELS